MEGKKTPPTDTQRKKKKMRMFFHMVNHARKKRPTLQVSLYQRESRDLILFSLSRNSNGLREGRIWSAASITN